MPRRLLRFNPAAAVLTPSQWEILRSISGRRAIPGLEARNAANVAWARLIEMQGRALIIEKIQNSNSEQTRQLLQRPDILWRINAAVHRVVESTHVLGSSASRLQGLLLRCLQNVADLETYCTVWLDPLSAFLTTPEFEPIRKFAIEVVDALLERRILDFCRGPGTPLSSSSAVPA